MTKGDLTTKEVAAHFNVSPITARLWCRRGLFPNAYEHSTPRGSVWMIPEKDLEGFEPPKKTGRPPQVKTDYPKVGEKRRRKKRILAKED